MKINRIVPNCMFENGVSADIYFAGCKHRCKGCYETDLWDFNNGIEMNPDQVVSLANKYNPDAYVLLGGDPLFSPSDAFDLVERLRQEEKPIWLLTGFTRKQIKENALFEEIFNRCNVVKTGKYIPELKQSGFPSSSNQRVWRNR